MKEAGHTGCVLKGRYFIKNFPGLPFLLPGHYKMGISVHHPLSVILEPETKCQWP